MNLYVTEFPFEELGRFDTLAAALDAGFTKSQVWSVVDGDSGDVWSYGPSHHYVNLLHYVTTAEHHDGKTYYEENFKSNG